MIRLEDLSKNFGATPAVNSFSIEIKSGEVCVLIGPSGCGKTTLMKMINRLIQPTSGRILIDGKDTSRVQPELLRRSIGYAIQSVGLLPHMTVAENIAIVPGLLHWDKFRIAARVKELLELVGLNPVLQGPKYPHQLSGGEAQRIGVARALAADPPILLMDEPFGAVDPLTREKLQTQFVRIQSDLKKTVVLVTHDLDEAIRLADRIAIMRSGRLVQYDAPETILARPEDKFVHDFVGVDRALKRLSRISIQNFIRTTASVKITATKDETLAAMNQQRSVWVVDESGQLVGWADRKRLSQSNSTREATVIADIDQIAITRDSTLRQALSIMLGQGIRSIPAINEDKSFVGEVSLSEVEAATAERGNSDEPQG